MKRDVKKGAPVFKRKELRYKEKLNKIYHIKKIIHSYLKERKHIFSIE